MLMENDRNTAVIWNVLPHLIMIQEEHVIGLNDLRYLVSEVPRVIPEHIQCPMSQIAHHKIPSASIDLQWNIEMLLQ